MALLSADIGFLLLGILAIRLPRRWALPHETIGRELGRGEACLSLLPRGLVCNRFAGARSGARDDTYEEVHRPTYDEKN